VRKELANWVIEEQLNPKQQSRAGKLRDGTTGLIVRIPKAYLNDIVPRLLGLGAHATALQPPELVTEVRARLQAAIDRYGKPRDRGAHEGGKPATPRASRRRPR
jgi:predicted DNA-binding transcriptional regulator YafY